MSLFVSDRSPRAQAFGRIFPPDPQWLRHQSVEPVLDAALPIVDCHHHLWDVAHNRYRLDDFQADLDCGHNLVATVYMESQQHYREAGPSAFQPVGEIEYVARITAPCQGAGPGSTRVARGIVGRCDFTLGALIQPVLDAQIAAGHGRLCGMRFATAWDASDVVGNSFCIDAPQMLRRPEVRAAIGCLAPLGLVFDAWVFHPQLHEVGELASDFPDLTIVLGHTGGVLGYGPYAGQRDAVFGAWRSAMAALAQHPNLVVKLGGMLMRHAGLDYLNLPAPPSSTELAAQWRPYMETCIELFGAHRCMFESNFPVEKMGTGYGVLWNAFKRVAAGASDSEKQALFAGTAQRVYRLG